MHARATRADAVRRQPSTNSTRRDRSPARPRRHSLRDGAADGTRVGRIVARSRADGWRYLTLSVYGTADWTAGSYGEFTRHHLPRALLRRSESGFLLRVETPMRPGESDDLAARRSDERKI